MQLCLSKTIKAYYHLQFLYFNLNMHLFYIQSILNIFLCIALLTSLENPVCHLLVLYGVIFYAPQMKSLHKIIKKPLEKQVLLSFPDLYIKQTVSDFKLRIIGSLCFAFAVCHVWWYSRSGLGEENWTETSHCLWK